MNTWDVVVIGAGAAGMMCAIEAGRRGRRVLVVERNRKPGEKIRISGGGRCNFTNLNVAGGTYLSANPKFALSALSRYTPKDFIALVKRHDIAFHDKGAGQLFCTHFAQEIIDMLVDEIRAAGVTLRLGVETGAITRTADGFAVDLDGETVTAEALVIATGGKSIPKMGATPFGYRVAEQFGLRQVETRPALVPLTFDPGFLKIYGALSGVSLPARVTCGKTSFAEDLLFTHRGLSGPAILQISSFWREGQEISIDMMPGRDALDLLKLVRAGPGKREAVGILSEWLPHRLAQVIAADFPGRVGEMKDKTLSDLAARLKDWRIKPTGTEGYRTAEVTLGGVDTRDLDAKTMQARKVPGLYFVGEVIDVTGWLGGYNFQWAWASGFAAGQVV
ncbi:MAG: NAD(P)/FAD-dependent oxidoreductase [Alphaproteobacteria bacterium]|nr:NAD(P)/FAD-dependent oxidoreductase [Alphaproteobacteria bacterium]